MSISGCLRAGVITAALRMWYPQLSSIWSYKRRLKRELDNLKQVHQTSCCLAVLQVYSVRICRLEKPEPSVIIGALLAGNRIQLKSLCISRRSYFNDHGCLLDFRIEQKTRAVWALFWSLEIMKYPNLVEGTWPNTAQSWLLYRLCWITAILR